MGFGRGKGFSPVVPPPSVTKATFYLDWESGWLEKQNTNWTTCREAAIGGAYEGTARIYIKSDVTAGGLYTIRRGVLRFNTSAIPSGATIVVARLSIYVAETTWVGGTSLRFLRDTGLGVDMAAADYGTLLGYTISVADELIIVSLPFPARYEREIHSEDLDIIEKGGLTIIGLRFNLDHNNITPVNGVQEGQIVITGATEGTNKTWLDVWYVT